MVISGQLGYLGYLSDRVHNMHMVDDAGCIRYVHCHAEDLVY